MTSTNGSPTRQVVFPMTPYVEETRISKCSIALGILFVIFFVLSIALVIVWAVLSDGFHNVGGLPDLCSTKSCVVEASRISEASMDDSQSLTCNNFYQFSCGRYHQKSKQPSYTDELVDATYDKVYAALTTATTTTTPTGQQNQSLTMLQQLFTACMDVNSRNRADAQPFINIIKNFPCGPIFYQCSNFNSDFYSYERHAGMLDWLAGSANLINADRDVHPLDRQTILLTDLWLILELLAIAEQMHIENLELILINYKLLLPPSVEDLLAHTKLSLRIITHFSLPEYEPLLTITIKHQLLEPVFDQVFKTSVHEKETMLDEVAELIVTLDKTYSSNNIFRTQTVTIGEMITALPQINWQAYLNAKFTANTRWNENDTVLISLDAFRELSSIVIRTPKRALANYLTLAAALNLRTYLYNDTMRIQPLHWKECVQQLSGLEAAANLFIRSNDDIRMTEILNLLDFMKESFINEHRKFAPEIINQLTSANIKVGYPQRLYNDDLVLQIYNNYEVTPTDYFTSIVTALNRQRSYENGKIGTRLQSDDSIRYNVLRPRIAFNYNENSFVVPLSYLQYPILLPSNAPYYTVYATLGVTFLQVLSKVIWSSSLSSALLEQAYQCMEIPLVNSQPSATLNFGIQQQTDVINAIYLSDAVNSAINSYSEWRNRNRIGEEARLPSLQQFDTIQEMFLVFSTLYCNPEGQSKNSTYRSVINAVAANSNAFTNSFDCPSSSMLFNRQTCT
uniref:Peptidase_M13_N domain-containing protein n=1 Tax=Syphacia muris TaxID=451379 RepID=A0A0N5AF96_9BILA